MKKTKHDRIGKSPDTLPVKAVLDELSFVRKTFHDAAMHYAAGVVGEIAAIREAVADAATKKAVSSECAHALREMLMLLRGIEVKPEKGRRRDLKKIESLVEELRRLVDGWN